MARAHQRMVLGVAWAPGDALFATAARDSSVKLWTMAAAGHALVWLHYINSNRDRTDLVHAPPAYLHRRHFIMCVTVCRPSTEAVCDAVAACSGDKRCLCTSQQHSLRWLQNMAPSRRSGGWQHAAVASCRDRR